MGKSAPGGLTGRSCRAGSARSGTIWTGEPGKEDIEVDADGASTLMCVSSEAKENGVIKAGTSCRESVSAVVVGTCRL
jgi:hypothetical protein